MHAYYLRLGLKDVDEQSKLLARVGPHDAAIVQLEPVRLLEVGLIEAVLELRDNVVGRRAARAASRGLLERGIEVGTFSIAVRDMLRVRG